MICGHVCVFLRIMSFCLCENQISLVLTYNAPWHVMTDLFASSRFIYGFGGGGVFILCPGLNLQLTPVVTLTGIFMLPRFHCGSIRNIRFACFDFENVEGRGPTLTNVVVLKLLLVD